MSGKDQEKILAFFQLSVNTRVTNRQVNTRVMNTNSEHEGDERRGEHEGEDGNLVLRTRGRGLEMRVAPLGVEEANRRGFNVCQRTYTKASEPAIIGIKLRGNNKG